MNNGPGVSVISSSGGEGRKLQSSNSLTVPFRTCVWMSACVVSAAGALGLLNDLYFVGWAATLCILLAAIRGSGAFMPLTLILMFNALFSVYAIPHVFFDVDVMSLSVREGLPLLTRTNWLIALFTSIVMTWVSSITRRHAHYCDFQDLRASLGLPRAPSFFYIGLAIITISIHFGIKGAVVVGVEGGYSVYVENLQSASGLQEYLLVPFLITALLIRSRAQQLLWYLVLAFFVFKLTLLGLRVVALMGVLMGFWFIGHKWTLKKLILLFVAGYLAFSVLGLLKGSLSLDELGTSLLFEYHSDSLVSHHNNVLWASSVMLGLIQDGTVSLLQRVELLLYFAANTIVPSGLLQSIIGEAYFGSWLQEQGYTSGGGHAAVYAYVAGGVPGVVFIASVFGWAIRRSLSNLRDPLTGAVRCWLMLAVVTFPRWVSYDIGNFLFRLPIYAAIIFLILHTIGRAYRSHGERVS